MHIASHGRDPSRSNACFGFDKTTGWTFFDLTSMHDSLENAAGTVLEADFYHADQLLPQPDQALVEKVSCMFHRCTRVPAACSGTSFVVHHSRGSAPLSTITVCPSCIPCW